MDLSIILVNYKSTQLALDCIKSIYQETKTLLFEIIVVDNFSEDNSSKIILQKYPDVKWISMSYNAGFSRANNAGIKAARGKFVLLLNTDTIILDGALDKAVELFKAEQGTAAAGVQLLNPDGSHQISGAHFVKGGLNFLLPLPYLGRFIRYWGYRLKSKIPSVYIVQEKTEVDWIVGAFILTTKETAMNDPLDEDFFMYAEEIEWCSRLKKYGKLYLLSQPKVIHLLGGSSNSFYNTTERQNTQNVWNKKGRQIMLSNLVRIRKQFGIGWYLLNFIFYLLEIPVFFFGLLFSKLSKPNKPTYHWKNFTDYTANAAIIATYFFRILFNNPFFYKLK